MDFTNMRFDDLLVADLGVLPGDARINEDIYDLLTLPYTLGKGMRTKISTTATSYDGDMSYQTAVILTKDNVETILQTTFTVTDGNAKITDYEGRVRMRCKGSLPGMSQQVELKFSDKEYESNKQTHPNGRTVSSSVRFQDYLSDVTSTVLWMDGIANDPRFDVSIVDAPKVTRETVGMLYHLLENANTKPYPEDLDARRLFFPDEFRVTLKGDDYHTVTVLREDTKVDDTYVQERYSATYKPAFEFIEITRERRPNDEKALRKLVFDGKPLVSRSSQSMHLDGNVIALNYLTATRELMKRLEEPERAIDPQGLLDDLAQDEQTL